MLIDGGYWKQARRWMGREIIRLRGRVDGAKDWGKQIAYLPAPWGRSHIKSRRAGQCIKSMHKWLWEVEGESRIAEDRW